MPQLYFNSKVRFSKVVDYGEQIMSNKPLEVGCRVLVVNALNCPKNIGKIGLIVSFSDNGVPGFEPAKDRVWEVECLGGEFQVPLSDGYFYETNKNHWFYSECLLRLPDEDEVKRFDEEAELVLN